MRWSFIERNLGGQPQSRCGEMRRSMRWSGPGDVSGHVFARNRRQAAFAAIDAVCKKSHARERPAFAGLWFLFRKVDYFLAASFATSGAGAIGAGDAGAGMAVAAGAASAGFASVAGAGVGAGAGAGATTGAGAGADAAGFCS